MIIYAVEVKAPITGNEWSIITIWNNKDSAEEALECYKFRWEDSGDNDAELRIKKLDTENECVYDYEE